MIAKPVLIGIIGTTLAAAALTGSTILWKSLSANADEKKSSAHKRTPVIVELFTSEG